MSEAEAERFRRQAEECRQFAEKTINPVEKEAWLRLATEWLKLAEGASPEPPKRSGHEG